ncbi:hexokinase A, partial [Serendipita sp. 399]
GADGTLYNKYPSFAERIHQGLIDVFGEKGKKIVTHHAEDGSGVGAAIIAGEVQISLRARPEFALNIDIAMTKARKDAGKYPDL